MSFKYIFILCLILIDLVLITNLISIKTDNVLGAKTVLVKNNKTKPIVKAKKLPTPLPSPTNTPTPTKSLVSAQSVTKTPTNTPNIPVTGDLLSQVNNFRAGKGLAPLSARSEVCFFANLRAQEIVSNFNHDGFTNRINNNTLPYPSYSSVAENIAMNPNPQDVVPAWINSPGHNANMSKDVPYGCVVGSGNYYVFEAWKP